MNKFLDELKYNVNSVAHKAKKGLLVGGLSLLAASSFVGCSKSSSDNPVPIEQEQNNAEKLEEKFDYISSEADELAARLETLSPYEELSDENSLDLTNFLLSYTFAKTSQNYNGEIPAGSIIPNTVGGKLDGTFKLSDEDRVKYFKALEKYNYDLYLDQESMELYNSVPDYTDNKDALSYVYTVKADLIQMNPELISELSNDDMLNLIKSSYVSAYNKNTNNEHIDTVDTRLSINLINENEQNYNISWTHISEDGSASTLESNLDSSGTDLVDDYEDVCIKYYRNDSNSSMLDSLKEANEKNEVSTQQIIDELIDIDLEKTHEEQKNQTKQYDVAQHSSETNELDR